MTKLFPRAQACPIKTTHARPTSFDKTDTLRTDKLARKVAIGVWSGK